MLIWCSVAKNYFSTSWCLLCGLNRVTELFKYLSCWDCEVWECQGTSKHASGSWELNPACSTVPVGATGGSSEKLLSLDEKQQKSRWSRYLPSVLDPGMSISEIFWFPIFRAKNDPLGFIYLHGHWSQVTARQLNTKYWAVDQFGADINKKQNKLTPWNFARLQQLRSRYQICCPLVLRFETRHC